MKFVKITAKNFLSFKELEYEFTDKPVLIQGENLSDDGQESNGACKSGIFNILELCLLGDVSRDQLGKELINFDAEALEVTLEVNCPLRKETLFIERTISNKSGGSSQVSVNGKLKYKFEDKMVSEINTFILDWMAISKKDLQNYFIINGENSKPLFKASNTENIELIGRFSNANLIDGVDKLVVEDCAEIEGRITQLNLNRSEFMGKITAYEEEIEKAKAVDFEQEKEEKIESQKDKIKEIEESINSTKDDNDSIDLSLEKDKEKMCVADLEASTLQDKIDDLKKVTFDEKYEKLDKSIESLGKDAATKKSSTTSISKELKEATQMLTEINNNIAGSVKCPKCEHVFLVADPEIDIEAEKEDKPKVEKAITSLNDKIKKIETSIEEIDVEIEKKSKEKGIIRKE